MRYLLVVGLLAVHCTAATADEIDCGGSIGEISFAKGPSNQKKEVAAVIFTATRDGRRVTRRHGTDDHMSLKCARTKGGKEFLVLSSGCGGSACRESQGVIDPVSLRVLVDLDDELSYSKSSAILGKDPKIVGELFFSADKARGKLYPASQSEIDSAIALYERDEVEAAIDLFMDLARRGSREAMDRLGSMYWSELKSAEMWCQDAEKHGPTKCRALRDSGKRGGPIKLKSPIAPKNLEIGMTKFQVERLYGPPSSVRTTTTRNIEDQVETWFYAKTNAILLFDYRGRLTLIQE